MIGHYYLSSDNEMCYSTKTNNFSPTKQDLNCVISNFLIVFNVLFMCSKFDVVGIVGNFLETKQA